MSDSIAAKALLSTVLAIGFAIAKPSSGPIEQPHRLHCEYQADPAGIDTQHPRLSWWLESNKRNQWQSAYQIAVASSRERLSKGQVDLWNSGKIHSDRSAQVEYGGKPLQPGKECWWQVRVWNQNGSPSRWSEPATWSMGLLKPSDWKGVWIGATAKLTNLSSNSIAGYHALEAAREDEEKWVQVDLGAVHRLDAISLYPPKPAGSESKTGFGFPLRFRVEGSVEPTFTNPSLIADHTGEDFPNPGDHAVIIAADLSRARFIRVTATKLWNRHSGPEPYCFALSELEVFAAGKNLALHAKTTAKDSVEASGWSITKLTDGERLADPVTTQARGPGNAAVMLRKSFQATKQVRRATAYLCGLGYSELMINGEKVGDAVLDPGFTDYRKRVLYVSYDVTPLILKGRNAVGILLGGGWFNAPVPDLFEFEKAGWSMSPRAIGQLDLEYTDGSKQTVATDRSWRWATGEIRFNGIRGGETIDHRYEQPGWSAFDFIDSAWRPVVNLTAPEGKVVSQQSPPIRVTELIRPVSVKEVKPGVYLFDMGVNLSGFAHLTTKGPRGTEVTLKYNEALLPDGTVNMEHTASHTHGRFQTDQFILKGDGVENFEPRFTYHGFRYVQVSGLTEKPSLDTLTGMWVTTDPAPAGKFECSNSRVNLLQKLFVRTLLNNMHSIPTDCPQREKMGWMDDGCVDMELAFLNLDTPNFYTKWIHDMQDAQDSNGHVPDIVPTSEWGRTGMKGEPGAMADPWWGGAIVFAPWKLYRQYGDTRILSEGYRSMKGYADYLTSTAKDDCVEWGLGDWLDESAGGGGRRVPVIQTSTAAYFYAADVVSRTAKLLGKVDDARTYRALAQRIRHRFNSKFYNRETGRYAPDSETAEAIPLFLNLPEAADRDRVASEFLTNVQKERKGHISAGIVGSLYVFHALAASGRDDAAWEMLTKESYPGWLNMVNHGATSLWEDWLGDNSLNHPTLGSVGYWLYLGPGGIRLDESEAGLKSFTIRPAVVTGLDWVQCSYVSLYGEIRCSWKRSKGHLQLEVDVPVNTDANIDVPSDGQTAITESGKVVRTGPSPVKGFRRIRVGSGHYRFGASLLR